MQVEIVKDVYEMAEKMHTIAEPVIKSKVYQISREKSLEFGDASINEIDELCVRCNHFNQ